ncbi:MAG: UvrD-helicase domain-containing protein [Oscillospiraceae bacterium]|nr:UvrD-helicase domain-containing protein [Oscillospiraceae bacterium]
MSGFQLTPAQARAVNTRGVPLLVSAAAGSGKTRVLTERLVARVQEGEDITRFLVITFTRAAAAELRGRILTELNGLLAENPGDRRLRRQSALLYRAKIGTIDSFCTDLVRENAHLLGISPSFSILDEEKAQTMRAKALEDVLERAYDTIEEDEGLRLLVDSVGAGRDDSRLAELILTLDSRLQSRAFPEQWAAEKLADLDVSGLTDAGQTPWGAWLLADGAKEAAYRAASLENALTFMAQPGNESLMKGYGPAFSDMALMLRDTARAAGESWDKTGAILAQPHPRLGSVRKFEDEAAKAYVKDIWDGCKAAANKLRDTLSGDSGSLLRGITASRPALEALMGLEQKLGRAYGERKRRADACDFSDVEHFCVRLLCGEDGGPSPLAESVSQRFSEVMVDECQDVNAVQ